MFFDISLIPLAVLIIVGQLKKAPPRLLNNPSYQKEREQVLKHRRILDTLGVGFALALMIIQWGNPALSLAFQAFVIWLIPSQLYDLWQKFNVPRGVLKRLPAVEGPAPNSQQLPRISPLKNSCGGDRTTVTATTILFLR